jgi:hypothetical protein
MTFPIDDYTPHGYLDTPAHTRSLTPRGVLRSYGAGFRWHFPAFAGMYGGRRETYRAGLRIALDGALDLGRFDRATSPYHSKQIVIFDLTRGDAGAQATYHAVGADALRATIAARDALRVSVHVDYERLLAANGEWGESGLVGRVEDGVLVLQAFEDGDAFALWSSRTPDDLGIAADPAAAAAWAADPAPGLPPAGFLTTTSRRGDTVGLYAVLGFAVALGSQFSVLDVILARGRTADVARRNLDAARREAEAERARKLADDAAFWTRAPRLAGDWPDHWRRGLVYDLETLRMMVKAPIGIYRHGWDAMQIQAPRVVLAETAIDALLLAYADPALAQELMLGVFLDAPAPNVPCTREDGTYNMVAADGTVCGTAPSWGYPWLVLDWLAALRPDRAWLAGLYPRLVAHLDWWLDRRRDAEGWLVYACSWESGQDDSPRFGDQPLGGGHPVRHIRPADLHAAFAHACRTTERFARSLARDADAGANDLDRAADRWAALAQEFAERTERLWLDDVRPEAGGWGLEGSAASLAPSTRPHAPGPTPPAPRYADFDTRSGSLTGVDDPMLLAPVALHVASAGRAAALRPALQAIDADTLTWPMLAWTVVEAALAAGLPDRAAELAAAICERAYGFWDARVAQAERTLPGIACEYWPPSGRCGGEGYGWGAFTTHLLLHALAGLTPTADALIVRPNLPPGWRVAGRRYDLRLDWRDRPLAITLAPLDAERVAITVNGRQAQAAWGATTAWAWSELA